MKPENWCCIVAGLCVLAGSPAVAQVRDYPVRAVRVIVPTSPGGLIDTVMRSLAQKMTDLMGQTVVVENRPGASTNIGTEVAARAAGDGYTLLANSLPYVVNASLFPKLPFDVQKDFTPVSLLVAAPYVIAVHPSVPAKSMKALIALARARPGELNYASGGNGTNLHVAAELLMNLTGIRMVHVPYKGGGPALASLVAGETDLSIPSLAATLPHIQSGRVRGLAITSARRSALLESLPTVAESGVPGYEFTSWVGMLAPASTPLPVIAALNAHIVKALRSPDLAARYANQGMDVVASSPEQFSALIGVEAARWAKVVKEQGLRAD